MAFCINCGQELAEGAKFCANCGKAANNTSTNQRKTVYDGELHKCPNCGELLKSFTTVCPTCAYELRGVTTNSPVEALAKKVEMASSLDDKIELITNFYIPNTKEDIYDFFILAISNIVAGGEETDAWIAKLEQTYQKARLLFGSNPDFSYFQELYDKASKQKSQMKVRSFIANWWMCILGAVITIFGLYLEIMGNFKGAASGDPDSPYYMLAVLALLVMGGGCTLFGLGVKYGISHSKRK